MTICLVVMLCIALLHKHLLVTLFFDLPLSKKRSMGLFGKIFGNGGEQSNENEKPAMPWKRLTEISQLDIIASDSKTKPVAIFKHSTTCGISGMVIRGLESQYDIPEEALDIYYLDLKAFRAISNEVAARFQVWHESPQIVLIKNGQTVYHDSHGAITVAGLKAHL